MSVFSSTESSRKRRYTTLKILLINKGIDYSTASKTIGMSLPSFAAKIAGRGKDFTMEELLIIHRAFDLDKSFIFDAASERWD